jgi:CheY-like chemotaxis protein
MPVSFEPTSASRLSGGVALVVDDELSNRVILKALLKKQGFEVLQAKDGQEAIEQFEQQRPDLVFMDVMMPGMDGYEATRRIKALAGGCFTPIIFLTALTDEAALAKCIQAGGDDFLTKPFSHTILRSKVQAMERIRALHIQVNTLYDRMRQEEKIAEQVFSTAVVADNIAMDVIGHRLQAADIFSGDLFLTARAPSGDLHLLLGDFTGHGLSAALGALPTAEVFRTMTGKGFSADQILGAINRKLHNLLPTGMFMAGTFVSMPPSLDYVQIFNCGLPEGLILEPDSHAIRTRVKSSLLPLGILPRQDMLQGMVHIPITPGCKVLLASDGVTEAHGPHGELFGQQRFEQAIADSRGQRTAIDSINQAMDAFCGDAPQADDISLVEAPCSADLFPATADMAEPSDSAPPTDEFSAIDQENREDHDWQVSLSLKGARLGRVDPVPLLINQIQELEEESLELRPLFTVLTELFINALDHGVLQLDSTLKSSPDGFTHYFSEREQRLQKLQTQGEVNIEVSCVKKIHGRFLRIRVEDSGNGFDPSALLLDPKSDPTRLHGRGVSLIKRLCVSLEYLGAGNIAEAVYPLST